MNGSVDIGGVFVLFFLHVLVRQIVSCLFRTPLIADAGPGSVLFKGCLVFADSLYVMSYIRNWLPVAPMI